MGSRRTTTRSSLGNGRSSNGVEANGTNRSGGCSYLSNVRPETRSTLCSVMAQLTEETQPFFETTLKSKAVSENCTAVKFSCVVTGHPAPQVMWYKDDMQLDRYCGLPKYEIFRNGQSHSLHIYNCTVEDAAIYQASAINSKGIVSCSGVLEVGEMNEFKIHQRYFNKLKQKAELKHKEAEEKENQEPLRTISPDRTQRKRRSTMEAFLSTPSSTEDEGGEENHQAVAVESEARLQEAAAEEVKDKVVPFTNGAVSTLTNGQAVSDGGSDAGTHTHDPKIPTTHQARTPFVKKKIKISNNVKGAKADTCKERVSAERRAKDEASPSVAAACAESAQPKPNPEEVMEVENAVNSSLVKSDLKDKTEEHQKPSPQEAKCARRPLKPESKIAEESSQKEQRLTASLQPATVTPTSHVALGTEGKKVSAQEKKAGHKEAKESSETQSSHPGKPVTQPPPGAPSTPPATLRQDACATDHVTPMDVDPKFKASSDGSQRNSEPGDTSQGSGAALPQRPHRPSADRPSAKPTSARQKKASVSRPTPPSEVTQAHAKMNRNGAPVSLEIPPERPTAGSKPLQRPPAERETQARDIHTSALHSSLREATDKMKRDTSDRSRESDKSHTGLFAHLEKPPLQSPGVAATRGSDGMPPALQSQADTALKADKGSEIHDEKFKGKDTASVRVRDESSASNEKLVETKPELHVMERTETEETKEMVNGSVDVNTVDASNKQNERHDLKTQETRPEIETLKSGTPEKVPPLQPKPPEIPNTLEHIKNLQEVQTPATKVISIAELLRSQIKALESSLLKSMFDISTHSDSAQDPAPTAGGSSCDLREPENKCKSEVKKSTPERKTESSIADKTHTNIKATLMEVYYQLLKDQDQNEPSAPVQELQEPFVIPPISVTDTGLTAVKQQGSDRHDSKDVMDVSPETEASTPPKDDLIKQSPPSFILKDELNKEFESDSNQSVPVHRKCASPVEVMQIRGDIQESNGAFLDHGKQNVVQNQDIEPMQKFTPDIKPERTITEMNLIPQADLDKIEDGSTNTSSLQDSLKSSEESVSSSAKQGNDSRLTPQQPPAVDLQLKPDSAVSLTPEPSPRLKRRNCVSPIPSATPQELASGARRKILAPKAKPEELAEEPSPGESQTQKKEAPPQSSKLSTSPATPSVSPCLPRRSPLLQPDAGRQTSPVERRSPQVSRRKAAPEAQTLSLTPAEEIQTEKKPEKDKHNPFKAPQVIRKIRAEHFADASGHLKLWCQFFNVLSDSTVKWHKNEEEITQIKRSAGDETQVNLAIVQASCKDSGVYGCSIENEYGTDSTDILLSAEILAGLTLHEDLGVGEEIEMTPLVFSKGVADSGVWGNKLFGRIMMKESYIGDGCSHKVWRAKVIYGLEPVFESGNTCVIKVRNPIAYGGKEESSLLEKNLENVKLACKIQNLAREYCKIFSAEARALENFGACLEVIPVYLMYRPANTVPYGTVETDLTGVYQRYSVLDATSRMDVRTGSEVEQKCSTLQHWIFQWTSGNLLFTRLEGVDTKITNVGISVKSSGHQGLPVEGNPKVFEQFILQHKCNYFCGLFSLRSLKVMDSLMTPSKPKGSRSPLLQRKMAGGSSSPQMGRKAAGSPRVPRKAEQDGSKAVTKQNAADAPKEVQAL